MPVYNYECEECGHALETSQTMSEAPLTTCPECKKETLERVILGVGAVRFKGSGFHGNDYDKHGPKKEE
jgi:putative FmdB family regulatory protein